MKNSFIAEGSQVYGSVQNSIISTGCVIEEGAVVENTVLMPDAVVGKTAW